MRKYWIISFTWFDIFLATHINSIATVLICFESVKGKEDNSSTVCSSLLSANPEVSGTQWESNSQTILC